MFKKIILLFVLSFISVSVFAQSIPSGTGRWEALGNSPFITDPAIDLNRNPAWGNLYRNYTFGDIGRANITDPSLYKLDKQYAGVSFGLGPKVFAGLIVNKNEGMIFDSVFYVPNRWGMGNLSMNLPIVPLKVFIGFSPNNGKFNLAGSFYYSQKSQDSTLPVSVTQNFDTTGGILPYVIQRVTNANYSVSKKSSVIGFKLGTILNFKDGWFEGNVDLKLNKMKYSGSKDSTATSIFRRGGTLSDSSSVDKKHLTTLDVENDGSMEFNAFLRSCITVNKDSKVKIIPYVNIGFFSWKPKYTPTDSQNDTLPLKGFSNTTTYDNQYNYFNINGGIGINMPVLGDGMLACGLSLGYNTYKLTSSNIQTVWTGNGITPSAFDTIKTLTTNTSDYKYTKLTLPKVNIGLEWKFTNWLTGRFGYSRAITNEKTTNTSSTSIQQYRYSVISGNNYLRNSWTVENPSNEINDQNPTDPIQTISLGLGFHFDRFSLDGLIGEKFFQKGVNLVSGQDDKEMFGVLSASYNFNLIK